MQCLLWLSQQVHCFGFNERKGWTVLITLAVAAGAILVMLFWFLVALLLRWPFQFSVRCVLLLPVIIVALPCGWLAAEMRLAQAQKETVDSFKSGFAHGLYDYEYESFLPPGKAEPKGAAWLRALIGDDFFNDVISVRLCTDTETERLRSLPRLRTLVLSSDQITDRGLANIAALTEVKELSIDSANVTDAGLASIAGLTETQGVEDRLRERHGRRARKYRRADEAPRTGSELHGDHRFRAREHRRAY